MKMVSNKGKQSETANSYNSSVIIWTFRRTGGTNLTSSIMKSLGGKTVEHEPFNVDRVYGGITAEWLEKRDVGKLKSSLKKILSQKISFKHCLEIIPMEINFLIATLSIEYGYKHLFLFRENAADRLLSLNYALKTGVWGSKQKASMQIKKDVFSEPIEVSELINQEVSARNNMRSIYDLLIAEDQAPLSASFESIYKSFHQYSTALVNEIFLELMGDTPSVLFDKLYESLVSRGSQGSNSDYMLFPGANELASRASKLPSLSLHQQVNCKMTMFESESSIVHSELWEALPSAQANKYYIHGVLLRDCNGTAEIEIQQSEENLEVTAWLPSARIERMYPNISGASECRFFAGPVTPNEKITLNATDDRDVKTSVGQIAWPLADKL
jgi:hypothetical protein